MKVYVVTGEENFIQAIFTTKSSAQKSFPGEEAEEHELCEAPIPSWKYWTRGAAVYPDGTFEEFSQEHEARGHISIEPCDDHLNRRSEPWDGHTQSHCGEHICIHGTDRELVEAAFKKHLAVSISRQNGVCQSKIGYHGAGDGRTAYQRDWHGETRPSILANSK